MEIVELDPDDREAVRGYVTVTNAVRRAGAPWEHDMTEREAAGLFRYGWDLEPAVGYVARVDGAPVAMGEYAVSRRDNLHLAWLDVEVHPEHRRRGHGSALLATLLERARSEGRTTVGIGWWEADAARGFAEGHGFEEKHVEVGRRQVLADLDRAALDAAYDDARPHAAAYDLVRRLGPTPEEELEAMAVMTAAINDAPLGGLDIEDEVYDAERIRAYETAMEGRGIRPYKVFARHRGTGELAGVTVVGVDTERPEIGEQHDTSVVAAHRGHRLGLLLKLEMLRWLHEAEPQLATIDTWNAEENRHMIDVNEVLGYVVLGRAVSFQRKL
ncbi:GNAT family N-acetyltransferase [Nocardioides sp. KIGAM211]|uniref:GNAT family N-acetyltransferase n=1 Tax=Nocardioides luti TaxID=2761101 RepID=A0A7X0V9K2_9ACTN|nr:GNAT family N-acetyltransferase [Nocardioides luti]MBB6626007.1 GNAT family N-acetyltransferase [Nocardioides luti]